MSKVIQPTRGESLYIWRKRRQYSQPQAAEEYGVHIDVYRDWERDVRTKDQPRRQLGQLKLSELCVLMRRRAGLTQRELAGQMDITRLWVVQMEAGDAPADRLREFWGV